MNDLFSTNWVPVPNAPYVMKYIFHDTGYHIMISNLTTIYSEKFEEGSILKRFCELNPFAQMKLQVILENLKKSLERCLTQDAELSITLISDKLNAAIEFSAGLVQCKYNFEMGLLDAEKITQHIICPTIFNAMLSHRKILELQKTVMAYDSSSKSPLASNISVSVKDAIDPDWLKGKNVSTENLLDSFLKIQHCFKDLYAENLEMYNASRKEKLRHSVQSASTTKKIKLQESKDDASNGDKFENSDEGIAIKEEETICSENINSQMKSNIKKKKLFKI